MSAPGATFDEGLARELHGEGHSCNAIAKKLEVAPSTISRWAKRVGLSFDRSQTALAVRAHVIEMAASRTLLAKKMLVVGHEAVDKLDEPWLVYSFGGRDNTYEEHVLDSPPIDAIRTAQMVAKEGFLAATKALELTPEGTAAAESVLDRLEAAIDEEFSAVDDAEFGALP